MYTIKKNCSLRKKGGYPFTEYLWVGVKTVITLSVVSTVLFNYLLLST